MHPSSLEKNFLKNVQDSEIIIEFLSVILFISKK